MLDEYGLAGEAPTSAEGRTSQPPDAGIPGTEEISSVGGGAGGYDALGDLLQKSPAFQGHMAARLAARGPVLRKQPLQKARDFQLSFGPVNGKAGTTETLTVSPQCYFRGEKLMATDTAAPPGTGTRIKDVFVGSRRQMPASAGGVLSAFMSQGALGSGVRLDTCQPGLSISIVVEFLQDCTFDAVIFGKAAG